MTVKEFVDSLSCSEVWSIINQEDKVRNIDTITVILENEKGLDKDFARQVAGKLLLRHLRGE